MEQQSTNRILALDILRGITVCGMILVNNPGGGEENSYAPLLHADWIGLTPTDLVFPFFMFVMGITTYISLRKYNFSWSLSCAGKIIKRALLLWFIGLAITWLILFTRGMISSDNAALGLWERICVSANSFDHIRILGVLPRLGICYGLAALVALLVKHKFVPWLIAIIFVGYYVLLELCNGYAHDETSILAIVDAAILGANHVYRWESPDPEGLLSTLPALGHVFVGFCVGRIVADKVDLGQKIERLFVVGALLMFVGFLLSYACPISKKMWTPTFAMVTCGMASLVLGLLVWSIDKYQHRGPDVTFFRVFGVNPLALFIISDILLIPCSILPLVGGETLQGATYHAFSKILTPEAASLAWAIFYILVNWGIGYVLYKKKIYFKL